MVERHECSARLDGMPVRQRSLVAATCAAFVGALGAGVALEWPLAGMAVATCLGVVGAAWTALEQARRPRGLDSTATATSDALRVGDLVVPRARIHAGAVLPTQSGARIELERGPLRSPLKLDVPSVADGRALLDALGLGTDDALLRRTVVSPLAPPWLGWLSFAGVFALGPVAALLDLSAGSTGSLLLALLLGPVVLRSLRRRITVGSDGVRIAWLGGSRFVPLADIDSAQRVRTTSGADGVRLALRAGGHVDIDVSFERSDPTSALIAERIEGALTRARDADTAAIGWLAHDGGLAAREWIAELRRAARMQNTMRGTTDIAERLWRVLEDGRSPAALRAAAAAALGAFLDDAGRERLRARAHATAHPELRAALEAGAENDDEALAHAIERLRADHVVRVRVAEDAGADELAADEEVPADESAQQRQLRR